MKHNRSWFARHKVLTGIGAVLAIGIIGSAVGDDGPAAKPKPATAAPAVTAEPAEETPTPEPTEEETASPEATADNKDAAYLLALDFSGMDTFENKSDATLIKAGKEACNMQAQGVDEFTIARKLENEYGGNVLAYSFLLGAAQGTYCPQ